ncbi:filamentous hemagglutinin N-terminal domain-containing protein [[Leptolyngbya] sp. PCC 7376]|uniref:filamentous hemagglutinin N-terminal domain-containing protein n=1 Tax=[Leptolyngbya] sp. PCC 7376 TaxID=111781 RepID=UPI000302B44B|nr:filamentous hemagglutinin N-terminal domain-containing protein [[Leptolyngbya] sp. PCC 7376]
MKYSKASVTWAIASLSVTLISLPVSAQLIPDGTTTTTILSNQIIRGDLAEYITDGNSLNDDLRHSFSEFNIDVGQRVYFADSTAINNIITRITGSNGSNILGTLGVDGNANLFLVNPNGFIFGSDASLDISGAFLISTASEINLGEIGIMNIVNADPVALFDLLQKVIAIQNCKDQQ